MAMSSGRVRMERAKGEEEGVGRGRRCADALALRKRSNGPVWFHTRVSSPPSKSSPSEKYQYPLNLDSVGRIVLIDEWMNRTTSMNRGAKQA